MKLIMKIIVPVSFIFLSYYITSCDSGVTDTKNGTISVLVVDNDPNATPVPDIDITIAPLQVIKKTDVNGIARFEVAPGNYFVDAEVCCRGPLNITYHEPVEVIENRTSNVRLTACLACE